MVPPTEECAVFYSWPWGLQMQAVRAGLCHVAHSYGQNLWAVCTSVRSGWNWLLVCSPLTS